MSLLKTIFFGTPDFALPSLKATFESTDLIAVICQPDRPRGRGQKLSPCPVKEMALAFDLDKNVKIFSPASLKKSSAELDELKLFLAQNSSDLFVVTAYGNLLTQEFLDMPKLGAVNVHASLLPKWRGAAPIQRSIEAGDTESGVSLQKMVMALDAGDVLIEKKFPISENLNAIILSEKLSFLGEEGLRELFDGLNRTRELVGKAQDSSKISLAPKIKKEEADWKNSWTANETHNRIRAFRGWPCVKAKIENGDEMKLLESRLSSEKIQIRPGEILLDGNKSYLGCADSALEIVLLQVAGKGPAQAFDYFQNTAKTKKGALKFI